MPFPSVLPHELQGGPRLGRQPPHLARDDPAPLHRGDAELRRRPAARFLWSHATTGRFSQQGRAALPGSSACRSRLEQACAGRGGRGVPRDSVRGAPACAAARHPMKLHISLCPHHCFRVAVFTDLKSRHHETTSEVEDFESSIWSKGRTLRWFSVRSGTKTARRVGADLRVGQGGSGPLRVRGAGVGELQSGRGGGWRMVRERGTGFKKLVR